MAHLLLVISAFLGLFILVFEILGFLFGASNLENSLLVVGVDLLEVQFCDFVSIDNDCTSLLTRDCLWRVDKVAVKLQVLLVRLAVLVSFEIGVVRV